jgi:hypothetical protein
MLVAAGAGSLVAAAAPHPARIVAINKIAIANTNLLICILSSLDQISALTPLCGGAQPAFSVFCQDVAMPIKFPASTMRGPS